MDIEVLERLNSKRNKVYKVRLREDSDSNFAIMKKYSPYNQKLLNAEYQNMQMLKEHGILIPEIIYRGSDSLIIEYIQGDLVTDLVERLDTTDWIDELAYWMSKLHRILRGSQTLLKGDVNLRNFIYSCGHIYGLDFEETNLGDPRTDLANICFFILTDRPSFTKEKHMMIRRFLNSYENHTGVKLTEMGRFLRLSKAEANRRRIARIAK